MPRGRPKESGYKNQVKLLELLKSGPKFFQEIVDELGLDRTIARNNLKILIDRQLVLNYREKHKSIYSLAFDGFLPLAKYPGLLLTWFNLYDELHSDEQKEIEFELEKQPYLDSDEFKEEYDRYEKYLPTMNQMYDKFPYWDADMSIDERIHWIKECKRTKQKKEKTIGKKSKNHLKLT